ncbi:MAG: amidohydrolase family protein [Dehalococcoidia bacterium]|nr:amidohydrolase family protein [Dehalococcoidia bacterium]
MSQDNTLRVILPGKLIDGIADQAQEGMAVAIQGSSIKWVGPTSEAASLSTNGADREILEFTQGTLLAGMFDIHTHTNMPGDGRTGEQVNKDDNDEIRLLRSAQNAAAAIASGVTTMCDCGSWNRNGFALKEGLAEGIVEGPRVLVSGPPLTVTGGHLWYMGGEADGIDAVRSRVRDMVKQGADFIKIAASGGSTSTSDPYRAAYSAEELNAIVEEAHNRNRPVLAHCRCTDAINMALDAGVDSILHCAFYDNDGSYRFDQPTADRLAASETWLNPTMGLGNANRERLIKIKGERDLTEDEEERLERSTVAGANSLAQFSALVKAGVKLVGGSDCGWSYYPFGDFQGEVMSLHSAGLTRIEAIHAGTRSPAAALGISDTIGTVEAGKEADLLVVNGDPSQDLESLRDVVAVFKAGKRVANNQERAALV